MKFLRNFLASFLALVVFSFVGMMFFFLIASALEETEKFTLEDNSVLKISLNQPLADRDFDDPFANISFMSNEVDRIGVVDLRKALEHAANDDKIKGVVLNVPNLMGGFSLGKEVRDALS